MQPVSQSHASGDQENIVYILVHLVYCNKFRLYCDKVLVHNIATMAVAKTACERFGSPVALLSIFLFSFVFFWFVCCPLSIQFQVVMVFVFVAVLASSFAVLSSHSSSSLICYIWRSVAFWPWRYIFWFCYLFSLYLCMFWIILGWIVGLNDEIYK